MTTRFSNAFRPYLIALGVFALLIFFFSPSWGAFRLAERFPELQAMLEVRRGESVLRQVAHPGAEISDPLHRVIQWRLLFPLIGHVLNLPRNVFFALAPLGGWLTLAIVLGALRGAGLGGWESIGATIVLGAASWFFASCGWLGYFDSWVALGLVLLIVAEKPVVLWAACLLTPWVDERFVIGAPLALLCRYFWQTRTAITSSAAALNRRNEYIIPAGLLGLFLVIRLGVLTHASSGGATVSGYFADRKWFDAPTSRIVLGIWDGLRLGWVLVLLAIFALRRQPVKASLLAASVLALVIVGLGTAQDYSRSMILVWPAAVLGALYAATERGPKWPAVLGVSVGAALLLPAHHVMNDRVNPIYYLYHELAALDNPPPIAMPEIYELHAIHEMESGEFKHAEADLTMAIKLAVNPASPLKQRGILEASQHRWADALNDFSAWTECDPNNPDAWFMRAQVNLASGRSEAALQDFERARALARPGWLDRPDVSRFVANLKRAVPAK